MLSPQIAVAATFSYSSTGTSSLFQNMWGHYHYKTQVGPDNPPLLERFLPFIVDMRCASAHGSMVESRLEGNGWEGEEHSMIALGLDSEMQENSRQQSSQTKVCSDLGKSQWAESPETYSTAPMSPSGPSDVIIVHLSAIKRSDGHGNSRPMGELLHSLWWYW